ncbi:hypothetical protein AX15_004409 [Amanita polypyramis BW_CC]|nr:hypothetical protein AX15_004409 [Amanita polypyramis BW_CC]
MSTPVISSAHPPLGTLIDGGAFELVEVLGVGGYGVVYRAVDAQTPYPCSYAVKCLRHSPTQSRSRRHHHIREIALHQIASGHPGIVTLHKVVQDYDYTYIIMDYAPDHDLFTQILNNRRYLGDDIFIKHIFLQLLDAVEYIHSLGIYHRDLKPENILCFDDGYRVALTDFGLATTDKTSSEFKTGSVYHMSPECQGGDFAPTGIYSPRFNDIWSLGIILLNLATGRNPWKSATSTDPTFQAYLQDPHNFLSSVLPISPEVNDILVRVLDVDWRQRLTLRQLRRAIEKVDSFYADGVVFEGSLARCPWEVGVDLNGSEESLVEKFDDYLPRHPTSVEEPVDIKSCWSDYSSESDIEFTTTTVAEEAFHHAPWPSSVEESNADRQTWLAEALGLSKFQEELSDCSYEESTPSITHSPTSPYLSDMTSIPATPENGSKLIGFVGRKLKANARQKLTINTASVPNPRYYDSTDLADFNTADGASSESSANSSMMHTAAEYISYSSSFVMASPKDSEVILQTPESIDLSGIVDINDLESVVPWKLSTAVPVAANSEEMSSFAPRYHSTESFESISGPSEYLSEVHSGHGAVVSHDYIAWPGFYAGGGDDGGGGRGSEEPCKYGVWQGSSVQCDTSHERETNSPDGRPFNPFGRIGSGSSTSVEPPHRQMSHNRHPSEPLLFAKLWRQEERGTNTLPRRLEGRLQLQNAQADLTQQDPSLAISQKTSLKFPPATLQLDRRDYLGYRRHMRSRKPWFHPARFFPA